jgi:hypothetical protein
MTAENASGLLQVTSSPSRPGSAGVDPGKSLYEMAAEKKNEDNWSVGVSGTEAVEVG